ncbi:hypothetical protein A0H81_05987 [Grifola frondosa]|uniref:Uncharacterized protein n=1 Tax=Grifola frondosa TaxID=5627 RepID=A0A1C7MAQ9_GRIFR|nr:hypothetical protein A0H81_05987 [Grifola frondosa]
MRPRGCSTPEAAVRIKPAYFLSWLHRPTLRAAAPSGQEGAQSLEWHQCLLRMHAARLASGRTMVPERTRKRLRMALVRDEHIDIPHEH